MLAMGLAGLGVATYLSLRPSPALSTVPWLPPSLAHWADAHPRFDNFPGFATLCLPWFFLVSRWQQSVGLAAGLILFLALLETAQLAIPHRHCDPWDILWGGLGIVAMGILTGLLRVAWGRLRIKLIPGGLS